VLAARPETHPETSTRRLLGIARALVARVVELGQERVHTEQTLARQANVAVQDAQHLAALELLERGTVSLEQVDVELLREVRPIEVPELELQDHLARHPLRLVEHERALDRELPLVQRREVRAPARGVLVVDS